MRALGASPTRCDVWGDRAAESSANQAAQAIIGNEMYVIKLDRL